MRSKDRTFTVDIDEEGRLVITRLNGVPFDEGDREFVRNSITAALRQRNLDAKNATRAVSIDGVLTRTEGKTVGGRPFDIDSMVIELEHLRAGVPGLTKAQVARELEWYTTKVSDIFTGRARPHLSDIRDMGALPGISVTPMLIPARLVGHVKTLKEQFYRRRNEQ